MGKYTDRINTLGFKAKVALVAVSDNRILAELAKQCGVHSKQI